MQGGVAAGSLPDTAPGVARLRLCTRFNDPRQRMRVNGTCQAPVERFGHRRRRTLDRALGAQQAPKRGAASSAAMPRVDERERGQAVLANKRTGALVASTSRGRQRLKRPCAACSANGNNSSANGRCQHLAGIPTHPNVSFTTQPSLRSVAGRVIDSASWYPDAFGVRQVKSVCGRLPAGGRLRCGRVLGRASPPS